MPNPNPTPTVPVPRDVAERALEARKSDLEATNRMLLEASAYTHGCSVDDADIQRHAEQCEADIAALESALAAPANDGWSPHLHDAMNRNEYFDVLFRMPRGRIENHTAIWDCCMEMWRLKSVGAPEYLGQYAALGYRPLPAPAPKPEVANG